MNRFRDLSTVNKIVFLVVIMLLFVMGAGLTGYYYKEKARKRLSTFYNDRLLSIQWLNEARLQNKEIENSLYALIISKDISLKEVESIRKKEKHLIKVIKSFQNTDFTDYEKEKDKLLREYLEKILEVDNEVIKKEKAGLLKEAYDYFLKNKEIYKKMSILLKDLVQFNQEYAYEINEQNEQDAILASRIILLTILLAVILSFITVLLISKDVDNSLKKLLQKVSLISKGQLNIKDIEIKSKNEFGQLSNAMNDMAEDLSGMLFREQFLRDIILSSITSVDIKEIQKKLVTKTAHFFGADRCFFIEYDEDIKDFKEIKEHAQYASGDDVLSVVGLKLSRKHMSFMDEKVMKQRETFYEYDINKADVPESFKKILEKYGPKSALVAPVVYKNKIMGLLIMDTVKKHKEINPKYIDLFSTVANQSAVIFSQAGLYEQIQFSKNREIRLRNIITEVLSCDNLNCALNKILQKLSEVFGVNYCGYRIYDENSRKFNLLSDYFPLEQEKWKGLRKVLLSKDGREILLKVLVEKKEPLVVYAREEVLNSEIKQAFEEHDIQSGIILPCFYQNSLLSVITLFDSDPKLDWKKEDLDFLNLLMPIMSACLSMFHLNEKLKNSFTVEKSLREIIINIKSIADENLRYEYVMKKLVETFDIDGVMYFNPQDENLEIVHQYNKNKDELIKKDTFCFKFLEKILYTQKRTPLIINEVSNDIENEDFKKCLLENNINSFIFYPLSFSKNLNPEESVIGASLLYSNKPRLWTNDILTYFCFMVDTINIIFTEMAQRQLLEETRQNFIATLTHDLRSPMLAEQKALEAIMMKKEDTPLGSFVEYLKDIHSTNEDLLKLINNLLSVHHYESGKFELDKKANNIVGLINDSIRSLRYLAEARHCEIISEVEDNIPTLLIDGPEVKRVLINLISNAIKHTNRNTKITITAKSLDEGVFVAINDNGPGILEEEKDSLFVKYQTKKRKVGSGLGLYLCKQIVEAHKGKIWFDTEIGQGTTFYFILPYES